MSRSDESILLPPPSDGYSAVVSLAVKQGARSHSLTQVGSGRLYFESDAELELGLARLERVVDGRLRSWMIRVIDISKTCNLAYFEFCEDSIVA